MIKRLLVLICLICLLTGVSRAADSGLTVWGLGDHNAAGLRVGYSWGSLELGGLSIWRPWEREDIPQTYGLYGNYNFPGEFDISQIPLFASLGEHISLASYVGIQAAIELNGDDEERGFFGIHAGAVLQKFIFDEVDDQIETITEVQWLQYSDVLERQIASDEIRVVFGIRIWFPN